MLTTKIYAIPPIDGEIRRLCSVFRDKEDLEFTIKKFIENTFTYGGLSNIQEIIDFKIEKVEYYTIGNIEIKILDNFFTMDGHEKEVKMVDAKEFLKINFKDICYKTNQSEYQITIDEIHALLDLAIIEQMEDSLKYIRKKYTHTDNNANLEALEKEKQFIKCFKYDVFESCNSFEMALNIEGFCEKGKTNNKYDSDFIYTKLVGISLENKTKIFNILSKGQKLVFIQNSTDFYDHDAVKVCTIDGEFIQYLPAYCSKSVAKELDELCEYDVFIEDIIANKNNDFLISIKYKKLSTKRSKIGSKKNKSEQYSYIFNVEIITSEDILYNHEGDLICDSSQIEIDRRVGEDYTSFTWNDGEFINITVYIRPIVEVINALRDKYSFEKYYGIPEKEKEATLKGISILVKPTCGNIATMNGQSSISDEECIKLILDYREVIFAEVKQSLHPVCEYSEEHGVYEYYLSGSLYNIHIDESEIETKDYDDYLAQGYEDEYN